MEKGSGDEERGSYRDGDRHAEEEVGPGVFDLA